MIRIARPTRQRERIIGPDDHGRLMTLEEYDRSSETPGYVYELIDGVLNVSPNPMPAHDLWVGYVDGLFRDYARSHPRRVNHVSQRCDVVVPRRLGPTRPQPDVAAYKFPGGRPAGRWDDIQPIIVAEVISRRRHLKDVIRNRHLYWLCRGIREYWVIDPHDDAERPTLIVLIRRAGATDWQEKQVPFGRGYRSVALPGLTINLRDAYLRGRE